jgi:4-diphosphocytidyl-2C-methyl-D-erythritol kinase
MGNVYLGKKLIQDGVSEARTKCSELADGGTAPPDHPEGMPVFDDADSVSSQDHSYVELIRDYASTTKKIFQCGKELYNNSNNSASNQESSIQNSKHGDKVSNKYDRNIQGVGRKSEHNALSSKFQKEDDNLSQLSDTVQTYPQEDVNNTVSNPVPDLVPEESRFLLSWKNLESLDTTDLVENSQKLLASVNKTLLNSETLVSRMKNDKVNSVAEEKVVAVGTDRCKTNADSVLNAFVSSSGASVVTLTGENAAVKLLDTNKSGDMKSVVRYKSADIPSAASTKRKERKLSAGRRRSVTAHSRTSLERRYSSDVSSYCLNLFKTNG